MEYVSHTDPGYEFLGGVELAAVGMEWPAATGPITFTIEMFQDVVVAANEDPHIQVPRLKIGHYSAVNGELIQVDPFEALGDAAPAFGRAVNLRLTNDGAILTGDFEEVPVWLADAMPSAYQSRSGDWVLNMQTPGGKRYSLVMTHLSLLGLALPACQNIDDLERLLADGPELPVPTASTARPKSPKEEVAVDPVATSVSHDRIRQAFNWEWAMDPENIFESAGQTIDPFWWWAIDIRVDPSEVIADDDEGNLWLVPFSTDGEDAVTFGDPVRVREVFVPVGEPAQTSGKPALVKTCLAKPGQRVIATNLGRPSKPDKPTAATAATNQEEPTVTSEQIRLLRERLELSEDQLPDDATDEQINAALAAEPASPDDPVEPEPIAASRGVTYDRDTAAQMQADAAMGREARTAQLTAEREGIVKTAIEDGKFPPAAATAYREQLDKGGEIEAQTRAFIESLAANTIPVTARGADGGVDADVRDATHEQIMTGPFGLPASKGA